MNIELRKPSWQDMHTIRWIWGDETTMSAVGGCIYRLLAGVFMTVAIFDYVVYIFYPLQIPLAAMVIDHHRHADSAPIRNAMVSKDEG
jgi:hypothetical protein